MGIPERRARERELRRQQIIDAAEKVFLDRGLDAARMEEIAATAELSKGALYLHFQSKGELYMVVLSRFITRLHGEIAALREGRCPSEADIASAGSPGARSEQEGVSTPVDVGLGPPATGLEEVRRLAIAQMRFAARLPNRFRLAMSWLLSKTELDEAAESFATYREQVASMINLHIQAIRRGQEDGSIRTDIEAPDLARQCWAAMLGVNLADLNRGRMAKFKAFPELPPIAQSFVDILMDGIAAKRGAAP